MTKKNEVAVTMSNEVAAYSEEDMQAWGTSEVSSKDIVIPSLILLQALSPQVNEGKGKAGDFIDSVTGENLGTELKDLVPFHMEKTWTVEKFNGKKWEWSHTEKMTLDNENSPYEFEVGNDQYRRKYTYRFFVLVEGNVLPYSIKMKGASKKTGSNLSTEMFVKNAMKRLPPAAHLVTLKSELEKNADGDSYYVIKLVMGGKTNGDKVMEALNWFKTIRKSDAVVVDDSKDSEF